MEPDGRFSSTTTKPGTGCQSILKKLTGLEGVYMEQLKTFGDPQRDPVERTISVAFFALIDIHAYEKQLSDEHHAEWFLLKEKPALIFDHEEMMQAALARTSGIKRPFIPYSLNCCL